jgi:F-type H+-transporting ATPase subunit a
VAETKRKGCLGCSLPILIIIAVVALVIFVMGFLAGPIGSKLFGEMSWLSWMTVSEPEVHLPAPVLFHIFGLPITNTILASWITVIFLVVFSWAITRRMKLIPGRLQAMFEALLGWMYDFCKQVAGDENGRRFFPMICTIFLFVLFNAWLSLIPGFGSIHLTTGGHEYELLRGANTDLNTPLAIALISFVFVWYYGVRLLGPGFFKQYFAFGGIFRGIGKMLTGKFMQGLTGMFSGIVDAFVGILELLSVFIRIVSFTFRLFGNMTAGEILLLIASFLVPWVAALPFYGLELLVGVVQALIFAGLTLVFVSLAVTPHEAEDH